MVMWMNVVVAATIVASVDYLRTSTNDFPAASRRWFRNPTPYVTAVAYPKTWQLRYVDSRYADQGGMSTGAASYTLYSSSQQAVDNSAEHRKNPLPTILDSIDL